MTPRRRKEVERVRNEGRTAALSGKHRETNPYHSYSTNRFQWWVGYDEQAETLAGDEPGWTGQT